MNSLKHRIARLEAPTTGIRACPECGRSDGCRVDLAVEWADDDNPSVSESCSHCGRRKVLALTFDER